MEFLLHHKVDLQIKQYYFSTNHKVFITCIPRLCRLFNNLLCSFNIRANVIVDICEYIQYMYIYLNVDTCVILNEHLNVCFKVVYG